MPETNEIIEAEALNASPEGGNSGNAGRLKLFIILGGIIGFLILLLVILFVTPLGKALFAHKETPKVEEKAKAAASKEKAVNPKDLVYISVPDILVNLRSKSGKNKFLKISLTLELEDAKEKDVVENLKPRIIDQFQLFLRELEIEDLTGSGALERLRHELVARVNNVCAPVKVADVLFKEMLIQ